jgi:hypothetical protein
MVLLNYHKLVVCRYLKPYTNLGDKKQVIPLVSFVRCFLLYNVSFGLTHTPRNTSATVNKKNNQQFIELLVVSIFVFPVLKTWAIDG